MAPSVMQVVVLVMALTRSMFFICRPYDYNRVRLRVGSPRGEQYINASFIRYSDRPSSQDYSYIATQVSRGLTSRLTTFP